MTYAAPAAARDARDRRPAAVLFDFGGTLDAAAVTWKERIFRLCRAEGVAVTAEEFDPLFYRADDALVGAVSPTLSLDQTVHRLVTGVAALLRAHDERLTDRIATQFRDAAVGSVRDNMPMLGRLAARYRLGLVSNFYGNLDTVCEDLGLRALFSVIVDSTAVGCTKPDPRIFRHALAALGCEPGDALFVGDSLPRDMVGARRVGIEHVWLVGDVAGRPEPCCAGDRVIRSLTELGDVLL